MITTVNREQHVCFGWTSGLRLYKQVKYQSTVALPSSLAIKTSTGLLIIKVILITFLALTDFYGENVPSSFSDSASCALCNVQLVQAVLWQMTPLPISLWTLGGGKNTSLCPNIAICCCCLLKCCDWDGKGRGGAHFEISTHERRGWDGRRPWGKSDTVTPTPTQLSH